MPFVGVAQHRCAAGVVERGDPHRVDLGLVGDAQLALDFEFGGQPVGVPAESALHLVAAHGAVPRHDVFDVAGEQVPVVRQAVGERRPVVEHVLRGAVAAGDAGAEGVVAEPVVENLELECRKVGRPGGQLRIGPAIAFESALSVTVRRLRALVRCGMPNRQAGDDDALVRERRGTTPLATLTRDRSVHGCDGPTRSVLLGRDWLFFRRLPGDSRIDATATILLKHRKSIQFINGAVGLQGASPPQETLRSASPSEP